MGNRVPFLFVWRIVGDSHGMLSARVQSTTSKCACPQGKRWLVRVGKNGNCVSLLFHFLGGILTINLLTLNDIFFLIFVFFRGVCRPRGQRQLSRTWTQVGTCSCHRRRWQESQSVGKPNCIMVMSPRDLFFEINLLLISNRVFFVDLGWPYDASGMRSVQLDRRAGLRWVSVWCYQSLGSWGCQNNQDSNWAQSKHSFRRFSSLRRFTRFWVTWH